MESEGGRDLVGADRYDDGMTGIVTSGAPRANIDVGGEDVDEFTFAFVAPLCA